ncbi:MAG: hypothetical protein ACOC7K_02180 [bacterium]
MNTKLATANAVIAAQNFNPSIVSQIWLVDNGIVSRNEFRQGCVFTDMLAHVRSQRFELLVSPERLQLTPKVDRNRQKEVVVEILGQMVELLPHTPFFAAGVNLTWHVAPEPDINSYTKSLFFKSDSALFRAFDVDDAQFGGFLSKDVLGCRLKLDVKPIVAVVADNPHTKTQKLQLAFNFHLDLDRTDPVQQIKDLMSKWDDACVVSEEMLSLLEGAQNGQDDCRSLNRGCCG